VECPLGHAHDAVDDDRAAHPSIVPCSKLASDGGDFSDSSPRAWGPQPPGGPAARTSVYNLES
jgi:hypothetical protein